jgi:hypothetical protein
MIRNRGWFDVPLLFSDQRIAKITFEKGSEGEKIINEAFDAWNKENELLATFAVVFSSTYSKDEAEAAKKSLMLRFPAELKMYPLSIETFASSQSETLHRVLVKPLRKEEANTICSAIKAKGGACYIRGIESLVSPVAKSLFAEPRKVPSVAVRSDGTIIGSNAQTPKSAGATSIVTSKEGELKNNTEPTEVRGLLALESDNRPSSPDPTFSTEPMLSAANSNEQRMSPALWKELDALLHEQYKKCWAYKGAGSPQRYVPIIKAEYAKDGSLIGQPSLLNPPSDSSLFALAESAVRAVRSCSPLKIPKKFFPFYDQWKARILRFDPLI